MMLNTGLPTVAVLLTLTLARSQKVRLVGGPSPREGRLEVYHNGTWGTVCDDGFTYAAARVVCFMLGHEYIGRVIGNRYGAGSGPIWLDNVRCTGTETNIDDCRHRGWGRENCGHSEDVSVSCTPTVRLVGGPSPREGRLEVHHNGRWGTVCDDKFCHAAATVVCYELGYGGTGRDIGNRYGAGSGTIWLDNVQCGGTETNIEDCRHNGWGSHDCGHSEDVSVSCLKEVRLVGAAGSKGRLEVYHDGIWGTVCDNGFTNAAASVVCYMLQYGRVGRVIIGHGAGSGKIWLDNVRCNGSELHITDCRHNSWGSHSCQHTDDVSVSCIADSAEAVALVGEGNPRVGRLEVFHANQWRTVCDNGFTDAAARVVCYSLGFGYLGRKMSIDLYDKGDGLIWLDNVNCDGTERYIGECSHDVWGVRNCSHKQDVAVSCTDNTLSAANMADSTAPATGVRLAGGLSSRGRLEVLHNGVWGAVCGDYFTYTEGRVVCKMLGFAEGNKIDNINYNTSSNGPIWLDNLQCSGTERDIVDCSHNGWGVHHCQHRDDVALSCLRTKVEVRLNGGRDPREGRLEVFYNGVWGTACSRMFSQAAARVVCNMMGFGYIGQTIRNNNFGSGTRQITMNSVHCIGTEENIAECEHNDWQINSQCNYGSVAISCLTDDAVALFGGGSPREGRLEVYHNGIWGTVCDDGFTDEAAKVVCYSLGFGRAGREVKIDLYGIGRGQIWLDNIHCHGTERHISECSHKGWGVHNCGHGEDVAVSCDGDPALVFSPSASTVTSNPSTSDRDVSGTVPIVIVGVLLLVICIVIVVRVELYIRRNPRQERTEVAMVPMSVTASTNDYGTRAFDAAASSIQASNDNNIYINIRHPAATVAGPVGDVGDIEDQPCGMYETLPDDELHSSRVPHSYQPLTKPKPRAKNPRIRQC